MINKYSILIFTLYLKIYNVYTENQNEYCEIFENGHTKCNSYQPILSTRKRYIFYDVNPSEGFNLRRDVYIRIATFVNQLAKKDKLYEWKLVLPPWGNLYHWQSLNIGNQNFISWGNFFDVESLKKYAPVLEMHEFFKEYPNEDGVVLLDHVYFLRNDEEMFETGIFEDKNIEIPCPKKGIPYKEKGKGKFIGYFWGYTNVTARNVTCLKFHGTTFDLEKNLQPNLYSTTMFDRMEIPLHYMYGSVEYWKCRRSMRYNSALYDIANKFRRMYLSSNDIDDNTMKPKDWRQESNTRNALGGPYIAVHFRRKDFIIGHPRSSPTVDEAAFHIINALKLLNLNTVFIASDAEYEEISQLEEKLANYKVFRFIPTISRKKKCKDGGIAIIDQIICGHARYFLGTQESTFTFRIQEDREILGFASNTTFNRLCKNQTKCLVESQWNIVWN